MPNLVNRLDALIGIGGASDLDRTLLPARYHALQQQIPWLFGTMIAGLGSLVLALRHEPHVSLLPAYALLGLMALRTAIWARFRRNQVSARTAKRELRRTFLGLCLFSVIGVAWQLSVYSELTVNDSMIVAMFAGLNTIGASFALSSFPAGARIPLLAGALPFALLLLLQPDIAHCGLGLALIMVILLRLRVLNVHDQTFRHLVHSRSIIEKEKRRALEAEQRAIADKMRVQAIANTDPLTGLANRRGFLEKMHAITEKDRRELALILLDLDGFKPINDTFGHPTGDAMLIEVSKRLRNVGGSAAVVARLGGDEFAMLSRCVTTGEAFGLAKRAVGRLSEPFLLDDQQMRISACAGVSHQADEVSDAIRRADIALYEAKRRTRGGVSLFTSEMETHVLRRTSIEQALREPSLADDIRLLFQPIFHLETKELRSFEALARWRHPELGWISPAEFIPITEQISVLHQISDALLARAARAARHWPRAIRLSFNLSPVQLCSPASAEKILKTIAEAGLEPDRLQLEVTETALMADFVIARSQLSLLSAEGVRIILDDFGAGYSSISYLREMNFDAVKLDGSLIASITQVGSGLPLLQGVLALCRAMGQQCIAEHIEGDAQVDLLLQLGCEYGQGFGLCRPIEEEQAAELAHSTILETRIAQSGLRSLRDGERESVDRGRKMLDKRAA